MHGKWLMRKFHLTFFQSILIVLMMDVVFGW